MTVTITRKTFTDKFGVKNKNYWFGWNTGWAAYDKPSETEKAWSAIVADINEPRKDQYIDRYTELISKTLVENMENTSGTRGFGNNQHKYFFAPKDVKVTGTVLKNGQMVTVTRTITANGGTEQKDFNKLICKYVVKDLTFDKNENATGAGDPSILAKVVCVTDAHIFAAAQKADGTWEWDTKYKTVLDQCAIDYTKGAYTNEYLYSYDGTTYTKIAKIDQKTGDIELIRNDEAKLVLNLVGYKGSKHENINEELRNWVAIASSNECGVASKVVDYEHTPSLRSFMVSWQRPINLDPFPNEVRLDANTDGNIIYLLDLLHLYDWRGDKGDVYPKAPGNQGYMYDDHFWFWAYYRVNKITIDMNPAHILINMHQASTSTFVKLSSITTKLELRAWPSGSGGVYTFDLLSGSDGQPFNDPAKEADIEAYMGVNPVDNAKKEKFGAIYYANNGENVTEFDLKIPVTISYWWGDLSEIVNIHIKRTTGHDTK